MNLFPARKEGSCESVYPAIARVREAMVAKRLKFTELFEILDSEKVGLVSFHGFLKNLDLVVVPHLAQTAKEALFSLMDTYKIGLISLDQIRTTINSTHVDLRLREKEVKTEDNFEWVQETIKAMVNWI